MRDKYSQRPYTATSGLYLSSHEQKQKVHVFSDKKVVYFTLATFILKGNNLRHPLHTKLGESQDHTGHGGEESPNISASYCIPDNYSDPINELSSGI
jgi:hypothetical protein